MGDGASRRLSFKAYNANARRTVTGRRETRQKNREREREPGTHFPARVSLLSRLTLATVETVVREKYYYPGKSGGIPSRCQIGHVRMETRRKFLHPRFVTPREDDREKRTTRKREEEEKRIVHTRPLCINPKTRRERGETIAGDEKEKERHKDDERVSGQKSVRDIDEGLSPRASLRKGRRWKGGRTRGGDR